MSLGAPIWGVFRIGCTAILIAGCGDEVCLKWDQSEGPCPERLDLEKQLQCSGGDVESVDSPGTFEDGLCCYEATKRDLNQPFIIRPDCFEQPEPDDGGGL